MILDFDRIWELWSGLRYTLGALLENTFITR